MQYNIFWGIMQLTPFISCIYAWSSFLWPKWISIFSSCTWYKSQCRNNTRINEIYEWSGYSNINNKISKTLCSIIRSAFTRKVIQNNWARQTVGICPLSIVTSYILCLSKSGDSSKQTKTVHIYERLRLADTFTTLMSDWLILHNNYCLFQLIHFLCLRG